MAEIGKWGDHSFVVSPSLIRSFVGLTIKGSSETKEKEKDNQKYVSRQNGKPAEITLEVILSALTGNDVRSEAMQFVQEARSGKKGYFYIGGKKLVTCQLMLTDANVTETQIAGEGTWVSCKVQLTLKQCEKNGKTESSSTSNTSGGSGGSKQSVNKTNPISGFVSKVADAVKNVATKVKDAVKNIAKSSVVKSAVSTISKIVSNAKKQSSETKKKTTTVQKITPAKKNLKIKLLAK